MANKGIRDIIEDSVDEYKSHVRGVSPVVGVILMVAITVILAAILGAFVLDLGDNTPSFSSAGVSVEVTEGGDHIASVQTMGSAEEIRVTCGDESMTFTSVGQSDFIRGDCTQVTVIGVADGDEQVIQTIDTTTVSKLPGSVPNDDEPDVDVVYDEAEDRTCLDELGVNGEGESDDPYVITNDHELQCVGYLYGNEDYTEYNYFELGNDIDASNTDQWNDGNGFAPIGQGPGLSDTTFNGNFDGDGYAVEGLYMNWPTEEDVLATSDASDGEYRGTGLFGSVARYDGVVQNLDVIDADVTAESRVGIVAGGSYGTLDNVHAEGTVSVSGEGSPSRIGGIAGHVFTPEASVMDSTASVTVDGWGAPYVGGAIGRIATFEDERAAEISNTSAAGTVYGSEQVGGLIGQYSESDGMAGSVTDSYSTATVYGETEVGGFIGESINANITSAYATGNVYGENESGDTVGERIGGFVGDANGDITDAYATGNVEGLGNESGVGGFVGFHNNHTIVNAYSAGTVEGDGSEVGGFTGTLGSGDLTAGYWDTEASGLSDSDGDAEGLTTDEMQGDNVDMSFIDNEEWANTSSYPVLAAFE